MFDLVVAHYKESLSWTKLLPKHIIPFVYSKGSQDYITLENIGRESHTYIFHIVNNYDSLSEWTFFVQGNPFDHCDCLLEILKHNDVKAMWNHNKERYQGIDFSKNGFYGLGFIKMINMNDQDSWLNSHKSTMRLIWEQIGTRKIPDLFYYSFGATLLIHKKLIRKFPLGFWKNLLDMHNEFQYLPWALEYLWLPIMTGKFICPQKQL